MRRAAGFPRRRPRERPVRAEVRVRIRVRRLRTLMRHFPCERAVSVRARGGAAARAPPPAGSRRLVSRSDRSPITGSLSDARGRRGGGPELVRRYRNQYELRLPADERLRRGSRSGAGDFPARLPRGRPLPDDLRLLDLHLPHRHQPRHQRTPPAQAPAPRLARHLLPGPRRRAGRGHGVRPGRRLPLAGRRARR